MPKLAEDIEVVCVIAGQEKRYEIRVDGEIFPWFTDGASVSILKDHQPAITVTIPALAVRVEHRFE